MTDLRLNRSRCTPVVLLMVIAVVAGVLAGCGSSLSSAEQIQQASDSADKGDYRSAEIRLKSLLQDEPANGQAWAELGRVSLATYRYSDAVDRFERAQANGVVAAGLAVPAAKALLGENQYQQALDELQKASPSNASARAEVLTLKGQAQVGLEQLDAAEKSFDQALKEVPEYAPALVRLAYVVNQNGDTERVHALLEQAKSASPEYGPAWLATARLAYASRNCEVAVPAFKKMLSLPDPGSPLELFEARSYLADCQLRAGEINGAKETVAVLAKQSSRNPYTNYLQALIDMRERNYDAAGRHLQQVLSVSPNSVRSLTMLAAIRLSGNDIRGAEAYLNQAIALSPDNVATLRLLATIYIQRDENERAIRMLQDAYSSNPDSDGIRQLLAQAMATRTDDSTAATRHSGGGLTESDSALRLDVAVAMAQSGNTAAALAMLDGFTPANAQQTLRAREVRVAIALRDNRPDKALADAEKLVADAPEDVDRLRLLANTYTTLGKDAEAGKTLDRALKLKPDDPELLLTRAGISARQADYAAARKMLERALELKPDDLSAQALMAQIAAAQGNREDAISWLEKAHDSHPDNVQLAASLVQAYLVAQRTQDALALANKLVEKSPDNPNYLRAQGLALISAGKGDPAISALRKAADASPDKPSYRLDLAQAMAAEDRREDALNQLNRLRRNSPDFQPAINLLARLQLQMGDNEAAMKTAQEMDVNSDSAVAVAALKGQILVAQEKYDEAVKEFASAYQAQPSRTLALALFNARQQAGVKDAGASLVDWLKSAPQDTAVTLALAQWYQSIDRTDAAEGTYRKLLESDPDNAAALNNLALIRGEQGDSDALEYARRAHKAAPDSPAIADTFGWMLAQQDKLAEATPLLRKAADSMSENASVQYHLAFALSHSEDAADTKQALKILDHLLQGDTQFDERESAQKLMARLDESQADT